MSSTTEEQLQVTTEPNVMELEQEFKRAYTDQKITHRVRDADETRYALWDGQNRDGKKHAADIGVKAFPWEGASDTRIRLADEVCKFIVNLKMPDPSRFYNQIEREIQKGNIRPINPKQLRINIFALSVFPNVASPLMKDFINAGNDEFEAIKEQGRTQVASFVINSIRL